VLKADAARLTQVLANLLNNAARYTPNSGLIELTAQREGDQAVIKVKDNGYGIPPQNVPHVFEMFYQGDDPRTARQSGLGIGLTLAKSLMEMHGGTIVAESGGIDRGSVFTLRLPIPAEVPAAVAAPQARTAAISGHRVLIVDDNADAARTLESLIHTLGDNDVHVELSGAAALAMVVDFRPDVVIVDLKMPEMDGYEVARRMRAQPGGNDILLVALTGWALDEHKRRSQAAGFDHHLTKPADRESLEALLAGSRPRPRLPPAEVPKTLH
jgi:CheY-like chemotaxis protein